MVRADFKVAMQVLTQRGTFQVAVGTSGNGNL